MKNAITTLRIQNFKSIKDVEIKPRRVNLILGEPNVGKSNLLEAISLLGGVFYDEDNQFMDNFIRYEEMYQLFYNNIITNTISIATNNDIVFLSKRILDNSIAYLSMLYSDYGWLKDEEKIAVNQLNMFGDSDSIFVDAFIKHIILSDTEIRHSLSFIYGALSWNEEVRFEPIYNNPSSSSASVRLYSFAKNESYWGFSTPGYLKPPFGKNLIDVIRASSELRHEISKLLAPTKQKLLIRVSERSLEAAQINEDNIVTAFPYNSIADTLQRLIFYLAAIESNDDAVLLFEEPEAHSFPTYVSQLGRRIVDSENNQFFVVTHSPYLVTEILEEMVPNDELLPQLAIFIAYYEDYQTKIRQLTDDEVRTIRANGTEMFYNLRQFTPAGQE